MVDKEQILKTFRENFGYSGNITIDDKTGLVSVTGDCKLIKHMPNGKLPVKFDKVEGNCNEMNLTTLEGSPKIIINRYFSCSYNKLTTLEHSPPSMNNHDFYCHTNPLINLNGLPENINNLYIHYSPNLPILKAVLNSKLIQWCNNDTPKIVRVLTNQYCGQGKAKMAECAIELVKAGYARNARLW